MQTLLGERAAAEATRVGDTLEVHQVKELATAYYERMVASLDQDDDEWLGELPGKPPFAKFASAVGIQPSRLKKMYLAASEQSVAGPFAEIRETSRAFSTDHGA